MKPINQNRCSIGVWLMIILLFSMHFTVTLATIKFIVHCSRYFVPKVGNLYKKKVQRQDISQIAIYFG